MLAQTVNCGHDVPEVNSISNKPEVKHAISKRAQARAPSVSENVKPALSGARAASVTLRDVTKAYGSFVAVHDLSLEVPAGQFVSLLGPSGCGKTSCLRLIAGFETPTAGRVYVRGEDVTNVPPYRRDLGMVFQSYALFPHMTVAANVDFGLRMRGIPKPDRKPLVERTLSLVKLTPFADRYPKQLSGGQQQRVALARAVVFKPGVLLLDESLAALDKSLREEMQTELRNLQRQLGITAIFVTHDQEEALTMSDIVVVMNAGRIEQKGSPAEVYERPETEFVARFLGASNILNGLVTETSATATRIRVLDRDISLPPCGVAAGQRLPVSLRPERIGLVRSSSLDAGAYQVTDVVYRGAHRQIAISRSGEVPLVVVSANTSAEAEIERDHWVKPMFDPASVIPLRATASKV
ncbi:MAG: hypothetical protein B7Y12_01705 [Rhizobiales bacterium 24-66-13]|jgi:putative spermidine/putrescine transport system ATP-binding protein/spermidine/putrescine transport system ATP-binding protein|uniref:ABC transporter ATP-binding protein n=1 Tax=Roseixanthobacter finlandensis TaxID=3119922 RepID=UPI000BDD63A8|nr:MAG: hypothetical protein B7Z41_09400 [Rhizobiales bacterium 12-66-7]OYY88499.1 MAG: hypothetical protein B7Y61_02270 [Rhizobiales bacterium 35-66-30]OYZ82848.1 MAG: hypothetical protein B7Y12_01705 [Rhizobiales bacterium 24-66-13]OZB11394.1 MAG: hypothetical protein B7X67_04065 [Rhizobiales bacterium 39-66-18]HQS45727.1 ABC transporter ATP-binding protein [Xanthobacteraceae bacterium]